MEDVTISMKLTLGHLLITLTGEMRRNHWNWTPHSCLGGYSTQKCRYIFWSWSNSCMFFSSDWLSNLVSIYWCSSNLFYIWWVTLSRFFSLWYCMRWDEDDLDDESECSRNHPFSLGIFPMIEFEAFVWSPIVYYLWFGHYVGGTLTISIYFNALTEPLSNERSYMLPSYRVHPHIYDLFSFAFSPLLCVHQCTNESIFCRMLWLSIHDRMPQNVPWRQR